MASTPFSEQLAELLKEKKMTMKHAAKLLECPYRTFQDWKLGNASPTPMVQKMVLIILRNYTPED